jgi:hypothetical protein
MAASSQAPSSPVIRWWAVAASSFKERDLLMQWLTEPSTSHPEMVRITTAASEELRHIPGVRNFGAHIGQVRIADEVVGVWFGENTVSVFEREEGETFGPELLLRGVPWRGNPMLMTKTTLPSLYLRFGKGPGRNGGRFAAGQEGDKRRRPSRRAVVCTSGSMIMQNGRRAVAGGPRSTVVARQQLPPWPANLAGTGAGRELGRPPGPLRRVRTPWARGRCRPKAV